MGLVEVCACCVGYAVDVPEEKGNGADFLGCPGRFWVRSRSGLKGRGVVVQRRCEEVSLNICYGGAKDSRKWDVAGEGSDCWV